MLTCPQCGQTADSGRLRLVQDTCGHRKCWECLVSDEASCWSCVSPVYTDLQPASSIAPPVTSHSASNDGPPIPLENTDNANASVEVCPLIPMTHPSEEETFTTAVHHEGDCHISSDTSNHSGKSPESSRKEEVKESEVKDTSNTKKRQHLGLKEHIVFTPGDPPMYHCKVCRKSYNNRKAARYHNYCGLPDKFKPHQCDVCGQGFVTSGHYSYHMKSHSGSLPFLCDICRKGFKQSSKLKRHMKSHEGEKPHKCDVCNRFFSAKHVLKDHMMIHTGNHFLSCSICCKKFSSKSCLRKHRLLHSDPAHKCDDCGKKFPVKWNLEMHRKTHVRERRHKCKQCNRAFKILSDLKRHATVHLEDGEWVCKLCKIVFRRKDNLVRHMKNIHPEIQGSSGNCLHNVKNVSSVTDLSKAEIETSAPVLPPQAVSVIRAVPVIQKMSNLERPVIEVSKVQVFPSLRSAENSLDSGGALYSSSTITPCSFPLQEENCDEQYSPRRDQNSLRESVVCHSDARGIVHYRSVTYDNVPASHKSNDIMESVEDACFSNALQAMQVGFAEGEGSSSVCRPRVIVEKANL